MAKQKKQTNSNLLGMVLRGSGSSIEVDGTAPAALFFRVGPPVKSQAPSFKLDRSQAVGYCRI